MGVLGERTHPCVGECTTTTGDTVCRGCGRTVEEIRDWPGYTHEQRAAVVARIRRTRKESKP